MGSTASKHVATQPARILVVEDSPTQAHYLAAMLEDAGHQVEIARDAESAWDSLQQLTFDLVLSDVHMPGESGIELCSRIKSESRFEPVKVVLLTALSDALSLMRGLGAGADYFMTKERGDDFLLHQIDRVLKPESIAEPPSSAAQWEGELQEIDETHRQLARILTTAFEDLYLISDELRASRESVQSTLRSVLNTVPVGVIITRADGTTRLANRSARAMLGIEELIPVSQWCERLSLQTPDRRPLLPDDLPTHLTLQDREARLEVELLISREDGEPLPVLVNTQPVRNKQGQLEEVITTVTSIVERKRIDMIREQLVQLDHLAAIGELATSIAHEVNNPSAYVIANLSVVRQHHCSELTAFTRKLDALIAEEPDPERARALESLLSAHNVRHLVDDLQDTIDENLSGMSRIKTIVSDLRDFARPPSSPPMVTVALQDIATTAMKMVYNALRYKTNFTLHAPPELAFVRAQPVRLVQAVLNLLLHAARSFPDDQRERSVALRVHQDSSTASIIIEANGNAPIEQDIQAIISPFHQGQLRNEQRGLSLSVCADIIKTFRGTLRLHPLNDGSGMSFEATFPLHDAPDTEPVELRTGEPDHEFPEEP
ncbi:response regulator [Lujinxingia vulgaris]|nr:response regulator [Lujinxingia vulgaris]